MPVQRTVKGLFYTLEIEEYPSAPSHEPLLLCEVSLQTSNSALWPRDLGQHPEHRASGALAHTAPSQEIPLEHFPQGCSIHNGHTPGPLASDQVHAIYYIFKSPALSGTAQLVGHRPAKQKVVLV